MARDHPALLEHKVYQGRLDTPANLLCKADRYYLFALCIQALAALFVVNLVKMRSPLANGTVDELVPWVRARLSKLHQMGVANGFANLRESVTRNTMSWLGWDSGYTAAFAEDPARATGRILAKQTASFILYKFVATLLLNAKATGGVVMDPVLLAHELRTRFQVEVDAAVAGRAINAGTPGAGNQFPWALMGEAALKRIVSKFGELPAGDADGSQLVDLARNLTIPDFSLCVFQVDEFDTLKVRELKQVCQYFVEKTPPSKKAATLKLLRATWSKRCAA